MGRSSNGCRICVRRKVRCDETRPQCLRCLKYGSQCPGYADQGTIVFIDETDRTMKQHTAHDRCTTDLNSQVVHESSFCTSAPFELDLSAFRSVICQTFLITRFVSTGSQYFDHQTNRIWMKDVLSDAEKYPITATALCALSECFYGRRHHQAKMVTYSMRSYSRTIKELRQTLNDGKERPSSDTLIAIAGLSYFELLAFTTSNAWLHHVEALSTIVQAKGRDAFRSSVLSSVLESIRPQLIGASIVVRKRTFLEDQAWKMDSSAEDPLSVHISELNHIWAQIPRITEAILSLQEASLAGKLDANAVNMIRCDILDIHQALEIWSSNWLAHHHHHQSSKRISAMCFGANAPVDLDNAAFTTVFEFDNLIIAKIFVDYWTIGILACFQLQKLEPLTPCEIRDNTGARKSLDGYSLALKICRSVPYFLQSVHIDAAPFYLSVPIRVAYLALPPSSAEAEWLLKQRDLLVKITGTEVLQNIIHNIPMRRAQ